MLFKSPSDAAANPASITSTFIDSSILAICIFSDSVIEQKGACSPSLKVVSNTIIFFIFSLLFYIFPFNFLYKKKTFYKDGYSAVPPYLQKPLHSKNHSGFHDNVPFQIETPLLDILGTKKPPLIKDGCSAVPPYLQNAT